MSLRLHVIINEVNAHYLACESCGTDPILIEQLNDAINEIETFGREPIIRSRYEYAKRRMLNHHSILHDGIRYVPAILDAVTAQINERKDWREIKRAPLGFNKPERKWLPINPGNN